MKTWTRFWSMYKPPSGPLLRELTNPLLLDWRGPTLDRWIGAQKCRSTSLCKTLRSSHWKLKWGLIWLRTILATIARYLDLYRLEQMSSSDWESSVQWDIRWCLKLNMEGPPRMSASHRGSDQEHWIPSEKILGWISSSIIQIIPERTSSPINFS